jgi:hypothetical protein
MLFTAGSSGFCLAHLVLADHMALGLAVSTSVSGCMELRRWLVCCFSLVFEIHHGVREGWIAWMGDTGVLGW